MKNITTNKNQNNDEVILNNKPCCDCSHVPLHGTEQFECPQCAWVQYHTNDETCSKKCVNPHCKSHSQSRKQNNANPLKYTEPAINEQIRDDNQYGYPEINTVDEDEIDGIYNPFNAHLTPFVSYWNGKFYESRGVIDIIDEALDMTKEIHRKAMSKLFAHMNNPWGVSWHDRVTINNIVYECNIPYKLPDGKNYNPKDQSMALQQQLLNLDRADQYRSLRTNTYNAKLRNKAKIAMHLQGHGITCECCRICTTVKAINTEKTRGFLRSALMWLGYPADQATEMANHIPENVAKQITWNTWPKCGNNQSLAKSIARKYEMKRPSDAEIKYYCNDAFFVDLFTNADCIDHPSVDDLSTNEDFPHEELNKDGDC